MKRLASNRELYEYLIGLAGRLASRNMSSLGEVVLRASRHASDMNTEFLGESRIALRRVKSQEKGSLSADERLELEEILAQLDAVLPH